MKAIDIILQVSESDRPLDTLHRTRTIQIAPDVELSSVDIHLRLMLNKLTVHMFENALITADEFLRLNAIEH